MKPLHTTLSLLAVRQAGAYLVSPPGTAAPGANADCSEWVEAVSGLTCANVEATYAVSEANFESWNPTLTELGSGCTMIVGLCYCVQIDFASATTSVATSTSTSSSTTSVPTTLITSTTTTSKATTTTGNGITTPTPTQTGMTTDCDAFHLVVTGDSCAVIAADAGISLDDFYSWNPAVGDTCATLDLGYYVCVDIVGYTATTTSVSTTTTSGNGITTPTPTQTGMVSNCNTFHLVVTGDTCYDIAADSGISLDTFYSWNPAVGDTCAGLDLGYYVCIGVVGSTTSATTTTITTTSGNGITTPTPTQTGMVSNCDVFHLVVTGDTCYDIAADSGISLDTFYDWNPAVGDTCAGLDLGYYVCIGVVSSTATTTTTATTATSSGNGVTTPTPTQTGMVSDCDLFHLVVSGDTCYDIAADSGISLATFYDWNPAVGDTCASLDLGYYVCIGIL